MSSIVDIGYFNPKERAHEKQKSRDEDLRQLKAGEVSILELNKRNSFLAIDKDRATISFPDIRGMFGSRRSRKRELVTVHK